MRSRQASSWRTVSRARRTCRRQAGSPRRSPRQVTPYSVFDFTGLGESEGSFESSTFVTNVGDLTQAALWLIDQGLRPCGMVGHSLGVAATLVAASRIRRLRLWRNQRTPVSYLISIPRRPRALRRGRSHQNSRSATARHTCARRRDRPGQRGETDLLPCRTTQVVCSTHGRQPPPDRTYRRRPDV